MSSCGWWFFPGKNLPRLAGGSIEGLQARLIGTRVLGGEAIGADLVTRGKIEVLHHHVSFIESMCQRPHTVA